MTAKIKEGQKEQVTLIEQFGDLPDPRVDRTKKHKLIDIIFVTICAAICGAEGWTDVEEFGITKQEWLKQFVELENGIPSHDTIGRVFGVLDPTAFEKRFVSWVQSLAGLKSGDHIAIDGKTLRHSYDRYHEKAALHLVSAWAKDSRLVLGQTAVDSKSNEITAIPQLLDMLAVEGCLISIDAMGCQTEIAQQIIDQGADYLLAVKDNQKYLAQDLQEIFALEFDQPMPFADIDHDFSQTIEKNHGRIETRQCWTISEPDFIHYIRNYQAWPALKTIILIRAKRQTQEGHSVEDRYYISSLPVTAKTILDATRSHWGIENSLHWVLDVVFREDDARMRLGHTAHNFALVRHIALNLLQHEHSAKKSIRARRLKAAWNDNYLLKVLTSLS